MSDHTHEMVDGATEVLAGTVESFKNLLVVLSDTDRSVVKRLGAKYNKRAKAWQIPPDHKDPSVFKDYMKGSEIGLVGREYITCAKADKDAAKALGAKWDPIANSWFNPEGNEAGEKLKEAFSLSTPEELAEARAARRDYIDVDRSDKEVAKALGAKFDPGLGSWCIPTNCDKADDLKAKFSLHTDERLYEMQTERTEARLEAAQTKGAEKGQGFNPDRKYIAVPLEDKDAAKALGAKWDGKAVSWYIPDDAKRHDLLVQGWPLQTPEQLQELQANKANAATQKVSSSREYVNVPKEEKDAAKKLGVRWDGKATSWYIPEGTKEREAILEKWSVHEPEIKATAQTSEKVSKTSVQKTSKTSEDKSAEREAAGKKAFGVWKNTEGWADRETSSFLKDKGVNGHGIKVDDNGKTLIPVRDVEGHIHSMQIIDKDGKETFLKGGQISGNMHKLGKPEEFSEKTKIIIVAQDYASGASIYEITKTPVVVAFHAKNIQKAAEALQGKYPEAKLIVAADHGKGQDVAKSAAQALGARLMVPNLSKKERQQGISDWNDLHQKVGPKKSFAAMQTALKASLAEKGKAQERQKVKAKSSGMEMGMGI